MPRDAAHRRRSTRRRSAMSQGRIRQSEPSQNSWKIPEKVSSDPHFKNLQDVLDHPGTFWILVSTCYDLGHTHRDLGYYLGRTVGELGRGICLRL